jgi:signal transduction histidine kinase
MAALIDTLLNVSRLESGRVKVEPKPCLLTDVVEEVLRDTEPTVKEKKLAIIKNFASDIPTIDLDINLIKIVIQNIMTNAIKYSRPKGDVTIDVVKEEDHVRVSVKDSGYGIPFKEQKNIFKKMFRAENVRAKQIDGNGLGLYIAKSVIEGFGGRIWFTSVEEKGTTFSITVPIVGMQAKEGDRTLIPEGGKGFTKTELRAARGE